MSLKFKYIVPSVKIAEFKAERGFAITGFHAEQPVGATDENGDLVGSSFGHQGSTGMDGGWQRDGGENWF